MAPTYSSSRSGFRPRRRPASAPKRKTHREWSNRRSFSTSRTYSVTSRTSGLSGIVIPAMVCVLMGTVSALEHDVIHVRSAILPTECDIRWCDAHRACRRRCRVDGMKLLDVAGPAEVFAEANRFGASYRLVVASVYGADVTTSIGTRFAVTARVDAVEFADTAI